jgi:4-hydroxybenzoate polyprenyltransferase
VAHLSAAGRPDVHHWRLRARIIHPFPTLLNVVAVVALALIASGGRAEPGLVLRMALTMFFIQCAIGATNDYFDRALDARSKPSKPLAAGVMAPRTVLLVAAVCVAAAALLAASLGAASWLVAMLGLGLGLSYNVHFKRTAWSAVPYLLAIPLVPVWVWLTLGAESQGVLWLLPLGVLAGLGLHLMNALTDFEGDTRDGVPGLAQRLGYGRALAVAWGSMGAALLLAATLAPLVVRMPERAAVGGGCGLVLLIAGVIIYRAQPGERALRLNFGLFAVATIVAGAAWLASA